MKVRIESRKPHHVDTLRAEGEVRVNNIPFTLVEGRLMTAPLTERQAAMFDGVRGFMLLREDLSVIRATDPASFERTVQPATDGRAQTLGGKPVDEAPNTGDSVAGATIGGKPAPEAPEATADASGQVPAGETDTGTPDTPADDGDAAGQADTPTGDEQGAGDDQPPAAGDDGQGADDDAGDDGAADVLAEDAERFADLERFTLTELRKAAPSVGVKNAGKLNKSDIRAAIAAAERESGQTADLPTD